MSEHTLNFDYTMQNGKVKSTTRDAVTIFRTGTIGKYPIIMRHMNLKLWGPLEAVLEIWDTNSIKVVIVCPYKINLTTFRLNPTGLNRYCSFVSNGPSNKFIFRVPYGNSIACNIFPT
jgi:hypothetical protein